MTYDDDPLTEKLRHRERAEEDVYFRARDRELIDRLQGVRDEERRALLREFVLGRCPECAAHLTSTSHHGVTIQECPSGHGMWMTETEAQALARRERDSWIARYLYRPRPVV
jgi:Transcription factor zinc-finger